MTLSSGWGGRGQGLGLLACVTGRVEGQVGTAVIERNDMIYGFDCNMLQGEWRWLRIVICRVSQGFY